ncbi:hypothetical protein OHA63_20820 [Streptomyces anulatus]|uniref:hypothetical protein n=1 Tax=Streptomyces anulatus TaxID=1892 RepID=UPI002E3653B8|nr:hypothetical protein [Streptomyces anulatus]
MSVDPWKDLSDSLIKLHDAHNRQCSQMMRQTTVYAVGSPADKECAAEPYAGVWGSKPVSGAVTDLLLPVSAALDHLYAVATLLTGPPSIYAPFTVARSVIEISVQLWYRLEPEIGAEERTIRYVNSRLRSLWEQSQMFSNDERAEARQHQNHTHRRMDEIVSAARAQNLPARGRGDGRRPPSIGSGHKGTLGLADECISATVPGLGSTYWRLLSSMAHGQAHGLVQAFTASTDGEVPVIEGASVGELKLSAQQAALRAAGAPLACIAMLDRLYAYLGWDSTEVRSAAQAHLVTWSRIGQIRRPGDPVPQG